MPAFCDDCGYRQATRSTADLPECVVNGASRVCDDCWAYLLERAEKMGVTL